MNNKKGFTLSELMVVILIIAILMAVAVPVYLASRNRAIARAAQSRLRDASVAAKNLYTDLGIRYVDQVVAGNSSLNQEAEPITFVLSIGGTPPAGLTQVYITARSSVADVTKSDGWNDSMTLQTRDANDRIWQAVINDEGAVTYSQQ